MLRSPDTLRSSRVATDRALEADMRHTELAKNELLQARAEIGNTDASDPMNRHHLHVTRALSELSSAIADIFDKLDRMDRKLDQLSEGPPPFLAAQRR